MKGFCWQAFQFLIVFFFSILSQYSGVPEMNVQLRSWLALGFPLGILVAYTAFFGVFRPDTYRLETPIYAAQAVGQDYANLFLVLPALTVTCLLSWSGSLRALLVHVGVLAYLLYSYSMYAITVHFNSMFLLYTACFGLSLYSLVGILANIDSQALHSTITETSSHKRLRISIASLFILTALLFYNMWLGEIIPHLRAGTIPKSIIETQLPSNMVHVLDLGVVLPLIVLTAVWLLSASRFGYLFAPLILTFSLCMMAALVGMVSVMFRRGQAEALKPVIMFGALFVINLAFNIAYLRLLDGNASQRRPFKRQ